MKPLLIIDEDEDILTVSQGYGRGAFIQGTWGDTGDYVFIVLTWRQALAVAWRLIRIVFTPHWGRR